VANPRWGTKRICQSCATKFYDLAKSPIVCPACGVVFDPEALLKSRRPRAAPKAEPPKPKKPKPAPVADDDDDDSETEDFEDAEADAEVGDDDDDENFIEDTSDLGDDDDVGEVVVKKKDDDS